MRVLSRLVLILGVPTALLAGIALLPLRWTAVLGLGGWNLSELRRQLVEAYCRRAEIQYQIEIVKWRCDAKRQVVEQVIAGHQTLPEAAAIFQTLNATPADCQHEYIEDFPGNSVGEQRCREVIHRVRNEMRAGSPDQAEALVARLEAELQEHLRTHNGTVVLPAEYESGAAAAGDFALPGPR
jgi:hypothetical protein